MRDLPSGTVTFLFTDIEGSTRLLHELGRAYAATLSEHRRVLRAAFSTYGGVEVDTQGDAAFGAFTRASDAVAAAEAIQQQHGLGPIRVRIGLHTGEPVRTEEGYVGIDVHRGARVCAAGHGGQVLLSQTTRDLVAVDARDLGELMPVTRSILPLPSGIMSPGSQFVTAVLSVGGSAGVPSSRSSVHGWGRVPPRRAANPGQVNPVLRNLSVPCGCARLHSGSSSIPVAKRASATAFIDAVEFSSTR